MTLTTGVQEDHPRGPGGGPCRRPGIVTRTAGTDIVLYDGARGRLHVLNPTAAFVWDLCDGAHPAPDIAARMASAFTGAAGHDTAADVDQILVSFGAEQLLEESPGLRRGSTEDGSRRQS